MQLAIIKYSTYVMTKSSIIEYNEFDMEYLIICL